MLSTARRARIRTEWFGNVRGDLIAGVVVALALVPEAIGFSIVAGVDPKVGLHASICIAIVTAFAGGRPAMISAATGAMALLMIGLVRDHGLPYLYAATIVTGVLQILFGVAKLGRYLKFVPRPVMVGFVNALAILIFLAQLDLILAGDLLMVALVLGGLAIVYLLPRLTTAIPSTLVAIVAVTGVVALAGWPVLRVADLGALPSTLPWFALPQVPFTWETLMIVLPYAIPLTFVGLVESLLTARIVDDLTDTTSDKHRESRGQGIANVVTGFFGGMAGCAMIGQSIVNVSSGGRGRLSTLAAGVYLAIMLVALGDVLRVIPVAALVAIMVMVSISTFDWRSLPAMRRAPIGETLVMVGTVAVVVVTHDLSLGVLFGVLLSAVLFSRQVSRVVKVRRELDEATRTRTYVVTGQLFFASADTFLEFFDLREDVEHIVLDLTHAYIWDATAVAAIDKLVLRWRARGVHVRLQGVNPHAAELLERVALHERKDAVLPSH